VDLALRIKPRALHPTSDLALRLLDERTHRKAENQAARPSVILPAHAIPEPCDRYPGGLAEPGRDPDEPVSEHRIRRKPRLPSVAVVLSHPAKELIKRTHTLALPNRCA
jgi:hypothetical protein